jgi:hypothetical protein
VPLRLPVFGWTVSGRNYNATRSIRRVVREIAVSRFNESEVLEDPIGRAITLCQSLSDPTPS